jgi:hypothetical protein
MAELCGRLHDQTVNSMQIIILFYIILYFALVRSKFEHASVACNSVTITDFDKLECIQRQLAAFCHSRFFQDVEYHYDNLLEQLNLLTLHNRFPHSHALFLITVLVA